ncbi:MAG: site-specific tyrosine recombinase XerD [Crocinitomicaceae bacterium]|nr:site-specific tyrosine recombinase XerD [Crocinitomicaceae bacterium]
MSAWSRYITEFVSYLKIEKGLSSNSIIAYENDSNKLKNYCEDNNLSVKEVQYTHLKNFVAELFDLGLSARSQARIISGIKQFYAYLLLENLVANDPSELLEQPKIGRKLPEVMTIEEIDELINANNLEKAEGYRNRAMLEVLYSCGLRVSELVELKFSDLFYDEGFVRVIGKGNKERLVPLSKSVELEIQRYSEKTRSNLKIKKGHENFVFLNRRGSKLTRVMIFLIIKELALKVDLKKKISPHTFRHSFATHLIEGGANLRAIQEMLGHESIITTEIYTHLDQRFLKDAILSYHPRNAR